jgi:transcriptional regulator with XRE-family HTH domain
VGDIDYQALVRLIRGRRRMTQEELARELDVTVGTLNGWENGRHRPLRAQRKRLERMAQELGIAPPPATPAIPTKDNEAATVAKIPGSEDE